MGYKSVTVMTLYDVPTPNSLIKQQNFTLNKTETYFCFMS